MSPYFRLPTFYSSLLTLAFLLLPLALAAQPFGFLSWSVEDGLPQSQVYALAEDSRGFIWAGTQGGGVARFDGKEFEVFTVADGLQDDFVNAIATDDFGNVVVGTNRGVAYRMPGKTLFSTLDLPGEDVVAEPNRSIGAKKVVGLSLSAQTLVVQTETKRYTFAWEEQYKLISTEDAPPKPIVPDELAAATRNLQPSAALPLPLTRNPQPATRNLVASRTKGLYIFDASGDILHHYTETNSDLPHNSVRALLQDRQGRFWLGTSGGGLVRMIPTGIRHYGLDDGLFGDRVYALHKGYGDKLWIGASTRGIQYLDSAGFSRPPIEDPTKGVKISSIQSSSDGKTYFSTDGRGVVVLDDSLQVERLTQRSGLASDWVMKLLPGSQQTDVFAITYTDGITRINYQDSAFILTSYNVAEDQQPLSLASAIKSGPDFYLGTTTGEIHHWTFGNTGPEMQTGVFGPDNGLPAGRIKALALRRGTQLWAAVTGYGLYYTDLRMPEPRFFPLPSRLRDVSTNIFQLTAPADRPELWIGTERGVDRLFLNDDGQPDYVQHYGRAEGFLGGETTGASLIDDQDNIWFGTMKGLVRYEESGTESYLEPPSTYLEGVDLFYTPLSDTIMSFNGLTSNAPIFKARENHFNFRYRAVDLTYPDRIRYRYRMTGLKDNEWSPLTKETAIRFAGLGSGYHQFTAQATTDGGKTFGVPVSFEVDIESPLLRKAWFLGLVTILGCGLLIGGFYYVFNRVQRQEAAKREELEARNQLLELEQKALRLQMNPHFIFNALNGIRGLVDGEHDAEARQQISRFATLMRGILNNSRQSTIPLADEIKVLDDYLQMEQFCQPFTFTYTIHVPENIDPEEVSLPPMLLQPFAENAVLHGLSGKENDGHIDVRFILRGRRMQCLVEDNGIGRKAAAERQKSRAPGHKSVALDVTRSRLKAMKGRLVISDRPGGGTSVDVTVPVEMW
jgi:ligand-binding sensor domain-containing protein